MYHNKNPGKIVLVSIGVVCWLLAVFALQDLKSELVRELCMLQMGGSASTYKMAMIIADKALTCASWLFLIVLLCVAFREEIKNIFKKGDKK